MSTRGHFSYKLSSRPKGQKPINCIRSSSDAQAKLKYHSVCGYMNRHITSFSGKASVHVKKPAAARIGEQWVPTGPPAKRHDSTETAKISSHESRNSIWHVFPIENSITRQITHKSCPSPNCKWKIPVIRLPNNMKETFEFATVCHLKIG